MRALGRSGPIGRQGDVWHAFITCVSSAAFAHGSAAAITRVTRTVAAAIIPFSVACTLAAALSITAVDTPLCRVRAP